VKKRRSKAQKAATKKMIAANRRKRSKGKRRGRKNPILVTGKNLKTRKVRKGARTAAPAKRRKGRRMSKKARARKGGVSKSAKRSNAAKKAARTRRANKEKRSLAGKKAARSRKRKGGGSRKKRRSSSSKKRRSSGKRSASRKGGKRKSSKRSLAAKKGARTRKRNASKNRTGVSKREKRDLDAGGYGYEGTAAGESRRKRRRSKRNPLPMGLTNPIPLEGGLDFFSGMFAVVIGYLFAGAADRMGSTHALTASTAQGGFIDAPAVGQIYDSEAPATPIWSSGMRIAYNVLAIAAPMGISAMIKSKGPKSFFQLMAMAAIARTAGKAAEDGMSLALKTTGFGLRLYAPEVAAQAKLLTAATTALPQAAPGTFAGVNRPQALNGAPIVTHAAAPALPRNQGIVAPSPSLAAPAQSVAGAPARSGGLDMGHAFVAGPAFNPFASTDS
jgi:hypothetical protein